MHARPRLRSEVGRVTVLLRDGARGELRIVEGKGSLESYCWHVPIMIIASFVGATMA